MYLYRKMYVKKVPNYKKNFSDAGDGSLSVIFSILGQDIVVLLFLF